ncbi:MAG: UDP-N-acetylmuramate dehydrogenase [Sedimentisphaerales bacterium]|nr:UDP-N-acetylmuramate dehydrogenase [Sedimentisphaerales bacterium]
MNLFAGLEEIVRENEPMAKHTWFRLGGPARYFARPRTEEELRQIARRCHENSVRMYVLGRGSNILVPDAGVSGVVVQMYYKHFGNVSIAGETVRAQAGASLSQLVRRTAQAGLSGMECLVGIPGTAGGAVKINAGGRFGDIGSVIRSVRVMDSSGYEFERQRDDIYFGYRMTNIIAKFILGAEFTLVPDDPERIGRMIREVWVLKKNSQPMNSRNAGCVFKNPRALSAGALIDKVGLKGHHIGGAFVSEKHANFIEARDDATSKDVLQLVEYVRQRVRDRFDVDLEMELDIWQ